MRRLIPLFISGVLLALATAACAGSALPTQSPDIVGTIVASTMAAITPAGTETSAPPTAALPTLAAPSSVPPTLPPVIATVLVPGAQRITFLDGATSAVVTASISAGQSQSYVLQALVGQPMMVSANSLNNDVTLSIKTQGGTTMLSAGAHQTSWQGSLPQSEDYYITLYGGASTQNFTLNIVIPSRIKFPEGADTIKIPGKTVAGYDVSYTAFAAKGQKMSVDLTNLSGTAALTVYGWTDGQPYVNANMSQTTHFDLTLPSTQDYIIQVVPQGGSEVSYVLVLKIK